MVSRDNKSGAQGEEGGLVCAIYDPKNSVCSDYYLLAGALLVFKLHNVGQSNFPPKHALPSFINLSSVSVGLQCLAFSYPYYRSTTSTILILSRPPFLHIISTCHDRHDLIIHSHPPKVVQSLSSTLLALLDLPKAHPFPHPSAASSTSTSTHSTLK